MTNLESLGESLTHIALDGKDIYLVGTAHVSKQSVEDVKTAIGTLKPDSVCIELCQSRYEAMVDKDLWKKLDIFKIIRKRKSVLFLAQLIMGAFYRKLGEKLGVQPGAEMLEAAKQAEKIGAELVLADREIDITLKRVWGYLGFWNKLKMMTHMMAWVLFKEEEIDAEMVEKIKAKDQLEAIMAEFTEKLPEVRHRLIDERDIFMSQKIKAAGGKKIVAVVGAGHVDGITDHIKGEYNLEELTQMPPKSVWPAVFKWGIPAAIIALLVYGFFKDASGRPMENIYIWVGVNGVLSALGAAVALAHPLTVVSALLAAPLTSLNPMVGAGWVAGLVQAWIARPTIADFEDLPNATSTVKGFWTNPVTKILLVVCLANLGSVLGTYIAGTWIASRTL